MTRSPAAPEVVIPSVASASTGTHERRLLFTLCLASLAGPMNFAMLAVALPTIADDLGVSVATSSWLLIAPSLASSSLQSIGGRLGDIFGYRRVFVLGSIGFAGASLLAVVAPGFWPLVAARVLISMCGGASQTNAGALVRVHLPAARRASAFGTLAAAISLAFAAGPLIGGGLVATVGWRGIFAVGVPFTLVAALAATRWVPPDPARADGRRSIDVVGAALWALSVIAIIMPLNLLRGGSLNPLLVPLVYLGTTAVLAIFIVWELRQEEPVVQVRLFTSPTFRAAATSEGLMNFSFFPIALALAVFMQTLQNESATLAGVVLAIGSITMVLFSPVGGRLADRFGRRRPAILGRSVAVLGIVPLLFVSTETSPILLGLWLAIMSIGGGLAWAAVQSAAVESAPRRYSGMANGVFATTANLGGIIGITWTSVYLGADPGIREFQIIFAMYLVSALVGAAISTRIMPWPSNEDEPTPSPSEAHPTT